MKRYLVFFINLTLLQIISAKEKNVIVFDDKITVYVHELGKNYSDRKRIKVDLAEVNVKLINIIRDKVLAQQRLSEEIVRNNVHITPKNLTGHYQFALELRNKKNKEYVWFDYEFTKEMSHIDKKLADSEEGKLILRFLREITTREKRKSISPPKKNSK